MWGRRKRRKNEGNNRAREKMYGRKMKNRYVRKDGQRREGKEGTGRFKICILSSRKDRNRLCDLQGLFCAYIFTRLAQVSLQYKPLTMNFWSVILIIIVTAERVCQ